MTPYFDTHAHYDDSRFDKDRDSLLAGLPQKGVTLALIPGCNLSSSRQAVQLAGRFDHIYAAVGAHPHDAQKTGDDELEQIAGLLKNPKVVALGEMGLDYHYDFSPRDTQRKIFAAQLELAESLGLPVIVHDREAHADTLDILSRYNVRAVIHCYSGSLEMAKNLVSMGHSISFTGSVTFPNARRALETAAWLPDDRIMLETDAPYLTPAPHRGKRNDSGYLPFIAETLAKARGVSAETLARLTYDNGVKFFGIQERAV